MLLFFGNNIFFNLKFIIKIYVLNAFNKYASHICIIGGTHDTERVKRNIHIWLTYINNSVF